MQLTNKAAWIPAEKAILKVDKAPYPEVGKEDVIVKNRAVAINPVDWKIQTGGGFGLSYPWILGEDVAGEVFEVGSNVKHLKKGDAVIGHALGLGASTAARGAFQLYPLIDQITVSKIPSSLSYTDAAVLPLSISTAAAGLYISTALNLPYPTINKDKRVTHNPNTKRRYSLLLWGGSSSVGSSVIQLAVASGLSVITTASPANYAYCKSLGASIVLDYHNPDVLSILAAVLNGTQLVGAYDSIGSETTVRQCAAILHHFGGGKVASVVSSPDGLPEDVEVARVGSENIKSQEPEVAREIWGKFIPAALESGLFKTAPEPLVVGEGLEYVQKGLDRQKKGVSARKVVVTL